MKKFIPALALLVLGFSVVGCSQDPPKQTDAEISSEMEAHSHKPKPQMGGGGGPKPAGAAPAAAGAGSQ